jgi:hypothetical protein
MPKLARASRNCRVRIGATSVYQNGRRSKKQTSGQQRQPGNDEHAMNCEICKVIRKLGLHKSAHELWLCTAKQMPSRRRHVAISNSRLATTSLRPCSTAGR